MKIHVLFFVLFAAFGLEGRAQSDVAPVNVFGHPFAAVDCNWDGVSAVMGDTPKAPPTWLMPIVPVVYTLSADRHCLNANLAKNVAINSNGYSIEVDGTFTIDGFVMRTLYFSTPGKLRRP